MIDREQRIAACADYLIGLSAKAIEHKHGIKICTITHWIRKAGFKLRNKRRINNHKSIVAVGYHG